MDTVNANAALINHFAFALSPKGLERTYGVIFDVCTVSKKFKIHFEVLIKFRGLLNDEHFIFELTKREVFVDHSPPEYLIDQLMASCGEVLYPLHVITGKSGEFKGINNKKSILERWAEKRKNLERYYTGDTAKEILQAMDTVLNNDRQLLNAIIEDQFIALYFSVAGQLTSKIGIDEFEISIPAVPFTSAIKYRIKQNVIQDDTDNGTVQIIQEGCCSDERSVLDSLSSVSGFVPGAAGVRDTLKGNINLKYSIYKKDSTIHSVTGSFSVVLQDGHREIKVQIYHLKEKDNQIPSVVQPVIEQPELQSKKRGFFSFFN